MNVRTKEHESQRHTHTHLGAQSIFALPQKIFIDPHHVNWKLLMDCAKIYGLIRENATKCSPLWIYSGRRPRLARIPSNKRNYTRRHAMQPADAHDSVNWKDRVYFTCPTASAIHHRAFVSVRALKNQTQHSALCDPLKDLWIKRIIPYVGRTITRGKKKCCPLSNSIDKVFGCSSDTFRRTTASTEKFRRLSKSHVTCTHFSEVAIETTLNRLSAHFRFDGMWHSEHLLCVGAAQLTTNTTSMKASRENATNIYQQTLTKTTVTFWFGASVHKQWGCWILIIFQSIDPVYYSKIFVLRNGWWLRYGFVILAALYGK